MKQLYILLACLGLCALHATELNEPHLTPEKLLGERFSKDTFEGIKVAVIGYCPSPSILEKYDLQDTKEQYFLHLSPDSVKIGTFGGTKFLCLYHVYGACISAALVEELAYYGIDTILAYGFAGGMGTKGLKVGDPFLIKSAYAFEGCSKYYTDQIIIPSDQKLNEVVEQRWEGIVGVQAAAVDVIYREYPWVIEDIAQHACDVVNCEASHLFAVAREVGIKAIQCGVVTDVFKVNQSDEFEETLSQMLSSEGSSGNNPLVAVNGVVQFLVEEVMPNISKK
ncbi:hypothetical protein K0U07_05245 [bacterium]|nr:hypothetical protein [bacterium]